MLLLMLRKGDVHANELASSVLASMRWTFSFDGTHDPRAARRRDADFRLFAVSCRPCVTTRYLGTHLSNQREGLARHQTIISQRPSPTRRDADIQHLYCSIRPPQHLLRVIAILDRSRNRPKSALCSHDKPLTWWNNTAQRLGLQVHMTAHTQHMIHHYILRLTPR